MPRRYGLGELPEGVYPREEDTRPWRPPAGGRPGEDITPVVTQARFSAVSILATIVSNEYLAGNDKRIYLLIQNKGSVSIYVNFGAPASANYLELQAGVTYEPLVVPTNSVNIIAASGAQSVVIIEGLYRVI